ncbi:MAG: hypothetical protein NVSMB24_38300 [Mucilaginibacter sp.]
MGNKILIIVDDRDLLHVSNLALTERGYMTEAMSSCENIFETIAAFNPHLIILDVLIAGTDGREVCKNLKSSAMTSTLPVILLTDFHGPQTLQQEPGTPDDIVIKPFDLKGLLEKVEKHLSA